LKSIASGLKRFYSSNSATKKQKISNRINWILRTHRYVIWNVSKKLGIKELKTNKYETFFIPTRDNTISKHLFISGQFDIEKLVKVSKIIDIKNRIIFEIKPIGLEDTPENIIKFKAATSWCESNNYKFKIIDNTWFIQNYDITVLINQPDKHKLKRLLTQFNK
jgi:hypothetical protein